MRLSHLVVLFGACLLTSCAHQRAATLRIDQPYDIPCEPYEASVRVGDEGFISFKYRISPTELLEVSCTEGTTFIGQIVPAPHGKTVHVTLYDGTDWKVSSTTFTNEAKAQLESRTTH